MVESPKVWKEQVIGFPSPILVRKKKIWNHYYPHLNFKGMLFFLKRLLQDTKNNHQGVLTWHMTNWFLQRKSHQKDFNFVPGFRNMTGCKLGWMLDPRSWCKGRSWTICPLGCLKRFIPLGLLTGCRTIRCPWSCVLGTAGLTGGEPCCTGISKSRGPVRFTVLGDTCGLVTWIWGVFSEKQEMES